MDKIEALKAKIMESQQSPDKVEPVTTENEEFEDDFRRLTDVIHREVRFLNNIQYKGIEKKLEKEIKQLHARFDVLEKMFEQFILNQYKQ